MTETKINTKKELELLLEISHKLGEAPLSVQLAILETLMEFITIGDMNPLVLAHLKKYTKQFMDRINKEI